MLIFLDLIGIEFGDPLLGPIQDHSSPLDQFDALLVALDRLFEPQFTGFDLVNNCFELLDELLVWHLVVPGSLLGFVFAHAIV